MGILFIMCWWWECKQVGGEAAGQPNICVGSTPWYKAPEDAGIGYPHHLKAVVGGYRGVTGLVNKPCIISVEVDSFTVSLHSTNDCLPLMLCKGTWQWPLKTVEIPTGVVVTWAHHPLWLRQSQPIFRPASHKRVVNQFGAMSHNPLVVLMPPD